MQPSQEEKKKLFSLFSQFKDDLTGDKGLNRQANDKVLIVDGLNTFIRCWAANPAMNDDGLHIGGVAGFLKSIGYTIKLVNPTRCVIVFDGDGGSQKRRKIYPEYKHKRKSNIRLNRTYEEISQQTDEDASKTMQLVRVAEYLTKLPVNVVIVDEVEADDTIAYCAQQHFKNSKITIMSSDKDFLQLVTDRIKVWSPSKKKMYGPAEVLAEYGIHPNNFALFRALDGDTSDNIDGVKGAGIKTAIKCFPFLAEDKIYSVPDLIAYAQAQGDKFKIYGKVVESARIVERNFSLMQLRETIVSSLSQLHIQGSLELKNIPKLDRYGLVKLITEDKMWSSLPNNQSWVSDVFNGLDAVLKS